MADNLPINFAIPAEGVIASYDSTDIEEGTGSRNYYGFVGNTTAEQSDTSNVFYGLSRQTLTSDSIVQVVTVSTTGATYVIGSSRSFSLSEFKVPQTIKGDVYISNSFASKNSGGGASTLRGKLKYILYKNSTEIGSAFTKYVQTSSTVYSDSAYMPVLVKISISTAVHFEIGDQLILKVEAWAKTNAGANGTYTAKFGTDPLGRDDPDGDLTPSSDSDITTQLITNVPFKINV